MAAIKTRTNITYLSNISPASDVKEMMQVAIDSNSEITSIGGATK